jgi:glutamate-ammonia-ligase adenylyltransferase
VAATIRGWHHGRIAATRTARGRELFTRLAPRLLEACNAVGAPDVAFRRFEDFFGGLSSGVQIQSLFLAQPRLLELLVQVLAYRAAAGHDPGPQVGGPRRPARSGVLRPCVAGGPGREAGWKDIGFEGGDGRGPPFPPRTAVPHRRAGDERPGRRRPTPGARSPTWPTSSSAAWPRRPWPR